MNDNPMNTNTPSHGTPSRASAAATQPFVEAAASAPLPVRFAVISRTGEYWSYPYAYVGLVECPTPELITIHCCDEAVSSIEITGRGLDAVATALYNQRLLAVTESDHADFRQDGVVVAKVLINRTAEETKK
jgi:hypothetical protein